jgi:RimJ/RimL family protein N-acetyltransferase
MSIDFQTDYVLENERVRLIPLTPQNQQHLLSFSEEEPNLWTYSLLPAHGYKNFTAYMKHAIQGRKEGHSYPFLVFDKGTNTYAGSTRFYDYQPHHQTIQLGYTWYGKNFQGTGLNKNCKYVLLQFAFEQMNLERVEFRADARNDRSITAMKSIGCTVEGILRKNCKAETGRRDSIILSILKHEWQASIKETLSEKIKTTTSL